MEKRIAAAPAAWAAAVIEPATPPIDITIVMIDVSMLIQVRETLMAFRGKSKNTHIMIIVTLGISIAKYSCMVYQKERAKVL